MLLAGLEDMGQKSSKIERKAKAIAKVVRNTKPTPVLHRPVPNNATLSRNPRWDSIFRAEGRDRLEEAVYEFLRYHDVYALLAFIAKEHNEERAETSSRFVLRYLDEADFTKMTCKQKSALVANMLQDELDLSGFRLGTALRRWRWIVQQTNGLDRLDDQEMTLACNSIFAFLHDHGLRRLVDCLQEEHGDEPGVREALLTILDTDEQTGESILYEVDPKLLARKNRAIATNVRDWLLGSELSFPETKFTASKDPWAGLAGEEIPKDQQNSMNSIVVAIKDVPICWNIAYQRALRHVEFYSLEDMIEALFEGIEEPRLSLWMKLSAEDMMRYGRRRQPAERVIAFIIDNIVFGERESRRLIVYDTSNTLMVRHIKTPKTQQSKSNSKRPHPIMVPPPEGQKQRSGADNHNRGRAKKSSPAAQELATVEALYLDLLKDSEGQRLENVELEEMISHLLEEIADLQDQVDMEADDSQQQERDCPICGQFLSDEKNERVHMKLHREEINECRKKNKRSPLPGSRSPAGLRKRRSEPSKSSSPSSKRGDSPKDRRRTELKPRRERRSLSGIDKKGRKYSSKSRNPSSKGYSPRNGGAKVVQSIEELDGQSTQQRPATGNAAAPINDPAGLGIWIPLAQAPLEANDALSRPPVMPGSTRPLVGPTKPKAKKRTLKAVEVSPPIPEGDDEGDGPDIVVGRVQVPGVTFDPDVLLTRPKKRSVGQAFVEFMRDHRESPEDARKRRKR